MFTKSSPPVAIFIVLSVLFQVCTHAGAAARQSNLMKVATSETALTDIDLLLEKLDAAISEKDDGKVARIREELVESGSTAVVKVCQVLREIKSVDESTVMPGLVSAQVLTRLSQTDPSTMELSIPCMFTAASRLNKLSPYIVGYVSNLSGPASIPYMLDFLVNENRNPPSYDENSMIAQGLVTTTLVNMIVVRPENTDSIVDTLESRISKSKDDELLLAAVVLVNLAPYTNRVFDILESAHAGVQDPIMRDKLGAIISRAKSNE